MSMRIFHIRTDILNQKYLRIYGTGLIILLLSFFVTLIKLILEKKKSTPTNTKFERPHQPVTSSFNIPDVSNRNNIQSHFFNDPSAPVLYVPQITTLESDPPSQPIRLQPSLSAIFHLQSSIYESTRDFLANVTNRSQSFKAANTIPTASNHRNKHNQSPYSESTQGFCTAIANASFNTCRAKKWRSTNSFKRFLLMSKGKLHKWSLSL